MLGEPSRGSIPAVYDTNLLFSAIYGYRRGRRTPPVLCWDAVLDGAVELAISPPLLDELLNALTRKGRLPIALASEVVELVGAVARLVAPPGSLNVLERDPADNPILECALVAGASFLVTGNIRHFDEVAEAGETGIVFRGVQILGPRDFLTELTNRLPHGHPFLARIRAEAK